ncbi:PAS domain-containing protein [Arcobacter arenosus]|uniref:Response regulator n=1 Tax=Arcobacter arenosus TaxID=2576037 RepID=A0A5R8Y4K2_9BACT|nr:PAS domain-containing protein [Arcobacter arenosus]TLP41005.1 response regulator [Arcobacter arenosus]
MASVDKKLLKRLTVLYVEDDDNVRNELTKLLSSFFNKIYTACDGKEGLSLYSEKKDEIDIIIADINMPKLTGIEMLEEIRTMNKSIPVIFTTAYSDTKFLVDSIKLKVFEYIIKPIDIRLLMTVLGELATILYHEFLLKQQNKELKKYKDIIYNNNIVIRTNKNLKISFVNDLFIEITGFDKKELIGKDLLFLKHKDLDEEVYKKIYNCVYNNKQWNGILKNITKDGNYYIANSSVITTLDDTGVMTGCLMIQKDETKEALKRREVQTSLIRDKSEIFKKSKETTASLEQKINILEEEIKILETKIENEEIEKNKYISTSEIYSKENRKLRTEVALYKKDLEESKNFYKDKQKYVKEISDLKVEVKRLSTKLETIEEDHQKYLKQLRLNYEVKIDDLEKELRRTTDKYDDLENAEAISQKLTYWKEKAKSEAKRAEKLERDILTHGDKTILSKLFGK